MSASLQQKFRIAAWTGGIAAVTAAGAWYGAGLKTSRDMQKAAKKRREATVDEKIAMLEDQRAALLGKRMGFEKKIKEIESRKNGVSRTEPVFSRERR